MSSDTWSTTMWFTEVCLLCRGAHQYAEAQQETSLGPGIRFCGAPGSTLVIRNNLFKFLAVSRQTRNSMGVFLQEKESRL